MKRIVIAIVTCFLLSGQTPDLNNQSQALEVHQVTEIVQPTAAVEPTLEPVIENVQVQEIAPEMVQTPSFQCGDNQLAYEIYMGESTCRIDAVNSIGACGIGQSLPCDKLSSVCPNWQSDYECQNRFFTDYAMEYGSWANAHSFKFCTGYCYSTRTKTTEFKPHNNPWW